MQMNRLFQIVYYLLENGKSSAPELAKKFEVSTRTIYRDLDTISAAGIPIYATQGKGGGISLLENYVLDKSIFSEKEQEQILIALQGIASTEGENADELLSKLSALFQIKWTDWIEVDFSDWNKNKADQIFAEVKKAIFDRRIITFSYFGSDGQYLSRSVKPIKLVFKGKDWYLYGFCLLRSDYRFFKLTRIQDLVTSAETFIMDMSDLPKEKMKMPHYNSVSVTLKFSPQVAFRVHDEFSDAITTDEENNLYVTANLPDHEVIYHYLLTFGEHVEVLSPAHIRDGIKEKVCSILKKYET
ncbi:MULTISPECIES: helix-turn-helix transcriptional regulator [Bacillota]|uniref:DNA-binding transcriptional regulator n=1 Tax=Blautia pseudococcoides TaxID=1796616 RepID=A0A1C7IEY4_9FIRM|nr:MULTISPECIES: YafY family protein [Bacillota]ANU77588.1 DNA-binding transcriptional regulator [Blautia pseudococcoides]ASU30392.1 YafY family transcriptional regulator [Blautia pseudococcoides]MCR2022113.1 YafY family transcriptional regulator [Blautia pseudococcoides]MDL4907107.1 YafY family protein [Enterococcus gallinarum]QQQ95182.1 YafY family transcriptional regulator [Blautia pseudococcoides]